MKENSLHIPYYLLAILAFFIFLPPAVFGRVLVEDTVWQGQVQVDDDILVPQGVTLTVRANTVVSILPMDSTKTDPEYMSPLTEITVRGKLVVEGKQGEPVIFQLHRPQVSEGAWSGIIVDGGTAQLDFCTVQEGEAGIQVMDGMVALRGSTLSLNRYGLVVLTKDAAVRLAGTTVSGNDYGLVAIEGASIVREQSSIRDNSKKDLHQLPADDRDHQMPSYEGATVGPARDVAEEVLLGDTVWQGRVRINGRLRVPVDSRLIIMPGTIVEFSKKDTNGDGIGENGLMLQGVLIAKGTAEKPIIFRSAEKVRMMGDWDAVNIINSDGARNIIEYCQFEDAYRGLHFHFSNVIVQRSIFRHNYRGIQFQESTVELRKNRLYGNISGVQARDSEITLTANQLRRNVFGANFLRAHLIIQDNIFDSNLDFGLKIREGYPTVTANIFHHNRYGLMFSDNTYGLVRGNLVLENGESGISIRTAANVEISGNFIQDNGLSGISVRDTASVIEGNHISGNGERGIGLISFQGPITHNTIVHNRLYAIAAEDEGDVSASLNWFGGDDLDRVIFDRDDDPGRGRVLYQPVAEEPFRFTWPLPEVSFDVDWAGKVIVAQTVKVVTGATLTVLPGTRVLFSRETGMDVRGRILAVGTVKDRIAFTAAEGSEPEAWGELRLEHADGSRFSNCDFSYATWGLHSHFTALPVIGCTFRYNGGGMRFRSGPVSIRNSLFSDNTIGMRAYLATAEISMNEVTHNRKGIFIREQGGGLQITENNIYDNADYNIWVGDFNTEDIQAHRNWWGIDDPIEKFFDARREPGIGTIDFEPALKEPLDIQIVDMEQQ